MKSSGASRVSRTIRRSVAVRLSLRSLVIGKAITILVYFYGKARK